MKDFVAGFRGLGFRGVGFRVSGDIYICMCIYISIEGYAYVDRFGSFLTYSSPYDRDPQKGKVPQFGKPCACRASCFLHAFQLLNPYP